MSTAAIAIDRWKLPTFRVHLKGAGYSYTKHPGLTPEMLILRVTTNNLAALAKVIEEAQADCAMQQRWLNAGGPLTGPSGRITL